MALGENLLNFRRGFTLLELLMVIGVVMIALGVSGIGAISHAQKSGELVRNHRQVTALLENARMEARASRAPVALLVRLNEESSKCQMTLAKIDGEGKWQPMRRWVTLKSDIELAYSSEKYVNACGPMVDDEGRRAIVFNAMGKMTNREGGAYIMLRDREAAIESDSDLAKAKLVYISPMTGKVN